MESTKLQVLAPDPFAFRAMTGIALSIATVGILDFSKFRRGSERSARGRPGRNAADRGLNFPGRIRSASPAIQEWFGTVDKCVLETLSQD